MGSFYRLAVEAGFSVLFYLTLRLAQGFLLIFEQTDDFFPSGVARAM